MEYQKVTEEQEPIEVIESLRDSVIAKAREWRQASIHRLSRLGCDGSPEIRILEAKCRQKTAELQLAIDKFIKIESII